jgi:hypothetical protein
MAGESSIVSQQTIEPAPSPRTEPFDTEVTKARFLGTDQLRAVQRAFRRIFCILRPLGLFVRLTVVVLITVGATWWGVSLKPSNFYVPYYTPSRPYLDVLATRPGVSTTIKQADLDLTQVKFDLDVTVPSGPPVNLYVKISGIGFTSYALDFPPDPPYWKVAKDPSGGYVAGTALRSSAGFNAYRFSLSFSNCRCYKSSGPYTTVVPLWLDLLSNQTSPAGTNISQPVSIPGPNPGLPSGQVYPTSLSVIDQDQVNLSDLSIPPNLVILGGSPQNPLSPSPDMWLWSSVSTASVTLLNIDKQDSMNSNLFYAGILFGIAGSGVIALVPETSRAIARIRKNKQSKQRRVKHYASQIIEDHHGKWHHEGCSIDHRSAETAARCRKR